MPRAMPSCAEGERGAESQTMQRAAAIVFDVSRSFCNISPPSSVLSMSGRLVRRSRPSSRTLPEGVPMTVPLQDESFMTHAVNAWADTVYRVALTRMRSPCDAEDVVQDVFVSLMRSARKFEDDKHLKAWLITATINRCRSLARAHGRRGSPSTTNSPRQAALRSRIRCRLRARTRAPALERGRRTSRRHAKRLPPLLHGRVCDGGYREAHELQAGNSPLMASPSEKDSETQP